MCVNAKGKLEMTTGKDGMASKDDAGEEWMAKAIANVLLKGPSPEMNFGRERPFFPN